MFTLLEQIYGSFDSLAKRKGIFKVETIGDCYVAASGKPCVVSVCRGALKHQLSKYNFCRLVAHFSCIIQFNQLGLPEARHDHAVVMIRFARDCLNEMTQSVHRLEVILGPDTSDLAMRFGIHSG